MHVVSLLWHCVTSICTVGGVVVCVPWLTLELLCLPPAGQDQDQLPFPASVLELSVIIAITLALR